MENMTKQIRYPEEVRKRGVRLLRESVNQHSSLWAATVSVAEKIGCSPQALRSWNKKAESEENGGPNSERKDAERLKELERENLELRRANEILRKASAFFAQAELDRRPK